MTWCAHVPFGADPNLCCATGAIEREVHALTLSQHAKDGAFKCVRGELVLDQIGIAQYDAVTSRRIERLDDALHTPKRYHR